MSKGSLQTAKGKIIAVQEQRFEMIDQDGRGLLLTLDRGMPLDVTGLERLQQTQVWVRVTYTGEPNWEHGTARSITPLEGDTR